jgi:hypothetical protein
MSPKLLCCARSAALRRAAIAGVSVVLALASLASPAVAADDRRSLARSSVQPTGTLPAGFTTWAELFAVQDKLNSAAARIVAMRGAGYAGIVAAPQNRALRVYWKGSVPTALRQLAGRLGVPVTLLPARFTERELLAEAKRLAADPRVRSVGPEVDGSGLTINVSNAGQQAIRFGTLRAGRIPLHVQSEPAPQPLDSRQNDISPYWGGGKYLVGGASCSTGFAVFWNGLTHMLSAGHCADNGQIAVDGGGNPGRDTMGGVFNDNNGRDTLMINTPTQGAVYIGSFNNNFGVPVEGVAADFPGNVVCTGGARTGEHCGLTVTHVNQSDAGFFPLTRAEVRGCAAARGDSGGPVYHYAHANSIIARGTISTGRPGTASCPNAPVADSSSSVFYAPLLRPAGDPQIGSLQFYGAGLAPF